MRLDRVLALIVLVIIIVELSVLGLPSRDITGDEFENNTSVPMVLVTGFEPFSMYELNPAQLIAEELDQQVIGDARVTGINVPVDFDESIEVVTAAIEKLDPVLVISIGLAPYAHLIRLEKLGLNLRLCREEDQGFVIDKIDSQGPFFRWSQLPTEHIVKEFRLSSIEARQSYFAGTYVCNNLLYGVLSYIEIHNLSVVAGFIHVPLLTSQDPEKGMELGTMVAAVEIAISVSLKETCYR
jgi:pyroglutamyl-peptidase